METPFDIVVVVADKAAEAVDNQVAVLRDILLNTVDFVVDTLVEEVLEKDQLERYRNANISSRSLPKLIPW